MRKGLSFDELNKLYSEEHEYISEPYDKYFGEMDITESQKEKRKRTAEKLEEIFVNLLAFVYYLYSENAYLYTEAIADAEQAYRDLILGTAGLAVSDYFMSIHIPTTIMEIVGTTIDNPEKEFNYTEDRAMLIAENEANSIWNDAEFEEALASGKTRKTWHSILDKRTRDTHRPLSGTTKPILEPFEVGQYLMQFPRDTTYGAGSEEIANCRCSVSYS